MATLPPARSASLYSGPAEIVHLGVRAGVSPTLRDDPDLTWVYVALSYPMDVLKKNPSTSRARLSHSTPYERARPAFSVIVLKPVASISLTCAVKSLYSVSKSVSSSCRKGSGSPLIPTSYPRAVTGLWGLKVPAPPWGRAG